MYSDEEVVFSFFRLDQLNSRLEFFLCLLYNIRSAPVSSRTEYDLDYPISLCISCDATTPSFLQEVKFIVSELVSGL